MIDNSIIKHCEEKLQEKFRYFEEIALKNQQKVLDAFKKNQVALRHFAPTTGYGYGDEGRETLNLLVADIFKAQKAICSPNIVSGTHAISLCLFGILRPNDTFLSITGAPYDTLTDVNKGNGNGSLSDFGIRFESIGLNHGGIDSEEIKRYFADNKNSLPKIIYLQRSRGYEWRNSLSVEEIRQAISFVRSLGYDGCVMVDNCYGEFVEEFEPIEAGANIIAGSMIKNMGGGIAPTGGYVAGDEKYVSLVENRLTAPSIGGEVASYANTYQYFFQGIFLAPHTVLQAIKGSLLFGAVLSKIGFETSPAIEVYPSDITRAVKFDNEQQLISFIQSVQANSPIDSYVLPEAWDMPGYENKVIMAAGCFVQGSSIELSADAPVKPPYIAYIQGGLTYEHCLCAIRNLKL